MSVSNLNTMMDTCVKQQHTIQLPVGRQSHHVLLCGTSRRECMLPSLHLLAPLSAPYRPSGFHSPERVKHRSSSRHSSQQQHSRPVSRHSYSPEQQQHLTTGYLGSTAPASTSRQSAARLHSSQYLDADDSSMHKPAAAAAHLDSYYARDDYQAHRQQQERRTDRPSSRVKPPRQPVPLFDAGEAPAHHHKTSGTRGGSGAVRTAAAGSKDRGGSSNSQAGAQFEVVGLAQLRGVSSSHSGGAASQQAAGDRVLRQLLNEGIEQTPIVGGGRSGKTSRRRAGSENSPSSGSSASDGGSSGSSGGRRHRASKQQQARQQQQRAEQHERDDRVLLERATLQVARAAASPVRLRRCSSPDVADAVVSSAAASAAAAGVVERAEQRRGGGAAASRSHSTPR
jgi:hypothetical protein